MALLPMQAEQLQEAIASGEIVFAYFWVDWQEECALTTPVIEQLADLYDGRAIVASVNADEIGFAALDMELYPLPMTIIYEGAEEVARISGIQPIELYDLALKSYVEPDEPNPYELINAMGYSM